MHAPARPQTWWQRLATAVRSSWSAPLSSNSPELARLWAGPTALSGVSLNENSSLTYAAVWAAVTLLSGDVASLPLILYKRLPNGGRERYVDHPLYRLLHDAPNDEMGSMTFREALTAHLLTWGNAYAEIERDNVGRPVALWPLTPERVAPFRESSGRLVYQVRNATGADTILKASDVLHIPGLGYDGTVGYSVIAKARESLGLGLAAERFGASFYGNGSTFGGLLTHPGKLSDLALKHLRESIEARHQGVDKAHRFLMLEEGMSFQTLGIPPEDAQFLETRQFQIEEVARWFCVPPHKIGHLKYATYSNIEHQGLDYWQSSLRRWLIRWEQEINRKLVAPSERKLQYAEHNVDALLRGDIQSRYAAYAVGRQWGWLSVDEVRERENLNPLPDGQGQMYLVPLNMTPASRLDEIIDKQVEPTPAPVVPPAPVEADAEDDADDAAAERARVLDILHTELDTARTDLKRAQEALKAAVDGRQKAEAEAGLEGALRLEAEARERELRERVAATEAVVTSLTTKLTILDELASRPTLSRADVVAPATLTEALATVRDAVSAAGTTQAEAHVQVLSSLAAQRREADDQFATLDAKFAAFEAALPDTVMAPVVASVSSIEAATATGLAAVAERHEQLQEQTYDVAVQLTTLTQRLAVLEGAATQAILAPPATVTGDQLAAVRDELRKDLTGALEAATARWAEERAAASEAGQRAQVARDAAVTAAHRTLIVDAMNRLLRIETDRARRASSPEKLERWIEQFYGTHADVATAVLLPAVRAHLAWRGSAAEAEAVTRRCVTAHVETSMRDLRMALQSDPEEVAGAIQRTLTRWEADRAASMADAILEGAHD